MRVNATARIGRIDVVADADGLTGRVGSALVATLADTLGLTAGLSARHAQPRRDRRDARCQSGRRRRLPGRASAARRTAHARPSPRHHPTRVAATRVSPESAVDPARTTFLTYRLARRRLARRRGRRYFRGGRMAGRSKGGRVVARRATLIAFAVLAIMMLGGLSSAFAAQNAFGGWFISTTDAGSCTGCLIRGVRSTVIVRSVDGGVWDVDLYDVSLARITAESGSSLLQIGYKKDGVSTNGLHGGLCHSEVVHVYTETLQSSGHCEVIGSATTYNVARRMGLVKASSSGPWQAYLNSVIVGDENSAMGNATRAMAGGEIAYPVGQSFTLSSLGASWGCSGVSSPACSSSVVEWAWKSSYGGSGPWNVIDAYPSGDALKKTSPIPGWSWSGEPSLMFWNYHHSP